MKKILAIDDQPDNLTSISAALGSSIPNYSIITAQTGSKGIDLATQEQPEAILLDIKMPEMDGFEVCKKLKANELTRHIPIIMLTATRTDSESRVKALDLGADAFLSKPLDNIELVAQVKVMLRIKEAEDKLRKENKVLENIVKQKIEQLTQQNIALSNEIADRKKSETMYHNLVETSQDLIWRCDAEGKYSYLNPAWEQVFGYRLDEMLGKSFTHFGLPEYAKKDLEQFSRLIRGKIVKGYETVHVGKNGNKIHLVFNAIQNRDEQGNFIGTQGTAYDITDRKKTEKKLQETKTLLQTVLNSAPITIFATNKKGVFTLSDGKGLERVGLKPGENLGKSAIKLYKSFPFVTEYGEEITGENLILRALAGETLTVLSELNGACFENRVGPLRDNSHEIVGMVGVATDITDRKKAEKAQIQSEQRYRLILENSLDAIMLTSPNGTIYSANLMACRLFQRTEEEICALGRDGLVDINDPRLKNLLEQRKKTGKVHGELFMVKKDGTKFSAELTSSVFYNLNGDTFTSMIIRDITPRKIIENNLQESEKKYRLLFQNLTTGFALHEIILDKKGNPVDYLFIEVNPAFEKVMGYAAEYIVGKTVLELMPGIEFYWIETYAKVALTGEAIQFEYYSKEIGKYFQVSAYSPEPGKFATIFIDITEQKAKEKIIRENEHALKKAQKLAHMGSWKWFITNNKLEWSDEMYVIFGLSSEEFTGDLMDVINTRIHPDDRAAVMQSNKSAAMHNETVPLEYRIIWTTGEIRTVWAEAGELILDEMGKPLQLVGVVQDITEYKRAENEAKMAKMQLEQLYAHQNQIKENERKAISREIHDQLGQALTAIKIDLGWMACNLDNKPAINGKINGMLDIMNNTIKTVQKISSDLRPGLLDDVGLIPAIEWYCQEFEKRIGISCRFNASIIEIEDENINLAIYRILQEALTNIMRHANATGVHVILTSDNKGLTLNVSDNGVGMDIVEVNSHKSLGLMGIKERIKQFDGTFEIFTAKDKGTTLVVFIPVK